MLITTIPLLIIAAITLIKFKPVYKVTISGEEIGYVKNISEFKKVIEKEVLGVETKNDSAIVNIQEMPDYELELASNKETNEEEIIEYVKETAEVTYKVYEVSVNEQEPIYMNSLEDAEEVVKEIEEKYEDKIEDMDVAIKEVYTTDIENIENIEVEVAKTSIDSGLRKQVKEDEKKERATINGVYLACNPTSGSITSRFGNKESLRSTTHKGLDIAAPVGTPIYAASAGTVICAKTSGGYGKVVKIDHGNGVETYYAHCSRLLVKQGQKVEAGDKIATMGSTGHSTGSHLHFEIRVDGVAKNPQNYMY